MPKSRFPRLIDLSQPITPGMPVYRGDPTPALTPLRSPDQRVFRVEELHLGTHTGTHLDAPSHFLDDGIDVAGLPLDRFVAPGVILDLRGLSPRGVIDAAAILSAESGLAAPVAVGQAVLLYTGWSERWGSPEYVDLHPGLDRAAAGWLVERRVAIAGIDSMNVDTPGAVDFVAHRVLLSAGVPIVENLTGLDALLGRPFRFVALPLAIPGASGSPVRAIALL